MKKITVLIFLSMAVFSANIPQTNIIGQSVVPNDKTYYKHKQDNIEILYTDDHVDFAKHTSKIEPSIHRYYEKFYDWKLDERLFVGLISDHNQIANGFSTQLANNRQINYVGGTSHIDYFTTTSWLDTLLYHETAHNYQLNVKSSAFSQWLHSIFGNGAFFIPTFTIPNFTENSFLLEGNAVLNESWHGNGGRLYSGRLKAETILQAKAGNIIPGEVYNQKIEFPYREIWYIQGGFYNLYMAEKYGLKNINNYFKYHSQDWWFPFFTNASMNQAAGINFETSLNDFASEYALKDLILLKGEYIASSQFFYSLNSDKDEVYFIVNESGVRKPELVVYDKKSSYVRKDIDSWSAGKVIKYNGQYLTQGSAHTSPTNIMQGLFDADKFLQKGTASRMIQGYTSDKKEVYFDVTSSYSEPQLYIDNEFYTKVNSSVIIDKDDNLYYFSQNGKTRTLYKNKKALFSFDGFYGIVSDVDSEGGVYFVANSKNGSTLYLFKNENISRVSEADNIVEAKLLSDNEVLIAAISDKDYYYVKTKLKNIDESPYKTILFFEDEPYYASIKEINKDVEELPDLSHKYNSLLDMKYSGSDLFIINSVGVTTGHMNVKFADPLGQNAVNIFVSRDYNNVTIGGVGYQSALNILNYGFYGYGLIDNAQEDTFGNEIKVRDGGVIAYASLPFYQAGYYQAEISSSYYQDYDTLSREPLSLSLIFLRAEQFGLSRYANSLYYLNTYATYDREDAIYGANIKYMHDLPWEFYISLNAKYSQTSSDISNIQAAINNRGVKMSPISFSSDLDQSIIDMTSIKGIIFVKNAGYVDVGLAKVINLSSYWFTFPLSLQRESIYANYRRYKITDFSDNLNDIVEVKAGLSMDMVLFNNLVFPLSIEYVNNNSQEFAKDEYGIYVSVGLSF